MKNEQDNWDDQEVDALINSFERMLNRRESFFFDVDDYSLIIDHYIDTNSVNKAHLALQNAMEQHPGTVIFQVKKAQVLAISNNKEQALQMLSRVENMEPFNTEIIRTKANIFSQLQQYENAIREYEKLSAEDDREDIYSNIAFEYENLGHYVNAIRNLKEVLAINPLNDNALYELAYCYEITDQINESIQYFANHLEEHPFSTTAWFNLGVAYTTIDKLDEALDAFEFVIALEPYYASAYFNKASVLSTQGKYLKAIDAYKDTFDLESPDALTFQYIGECYEKIRDFDRASQYYFKAIEYNESLAEAWAGLASVFYETNNYQKALSFASKARKLNSENPDFAMLHGDILKTLNEYEIAAEAYAKARELNPDEVETWLELAEVTALRDEDIFTGIEILQEANKHFPENASVLYRLSYYLLTSRQEKEAFLILQNALHLNYNKLDEFLDLDENLLEDPRIFELIEQAKQEHQNR